LHGEETAVILQSKTHLFQRTGISNAGVETGITGKSGEKEFREHVRSRGAQLRLSGLHNGDHAEEVGGGRSARTNMGIHWFLYLLLASWRDWVKIVAVTVAPTPRTGQAGRRCGQAKSASGSERRLLPEPDARAFGASGRRQAQSTATDFARVRVGSHRMLHAEESANVVQQQALAAHTRLSTEPKAPGMTRAGECLVAWLGR
jgi:hypothetical protein